EVIALDRLTKLGHQRQVTRPLCFVLRAIDSRGAPGALRDMHCDVRPTHQDLSSRPVRGMGSDPYACLNRQRMIVNGAGPFESRGELASNQPSGIFVSSC